MEFTKRELNNIMRLENLLKENNVSTDLFPLDWLKTTDFFRAPASTKYHAAYPGGLFDHSFNVASKLLDWTNAGLLHWRRPESPIIIGILHDATKIGAYVMRQGMNPVTQEIETCWMHSPDWVTADPIHGMDSVMKVCEQMELTYEEWACIRWHMGAYETDNWSGFDRAIKEYPNVLFTHTADMYASKLMELSNAE